MSEGEKEIDLSQYVQVCFHSVQFPNVKERKRKSVDFALPAPIANAISQMRTLEKRKGK